MCISRALDARWSQCINRSRLFWSLKGLRCWKSFGLSGCYGCSTQLQEQRLSPQVLCRWCTCCSPHTWSQTECGSHPHSKESHLCQQQGHEFNLTSKLRATVVPLLKTKFLLDAKSHSISWIMCVLLLVTYTKGRSRHLLADVFPSKSTATSPTFETSDVPLPLQSQQRLTLFDLLAAACTVWRSRESSTEKWHYVFKHFLLLLFSSTPVETITLLLTDGATKKGCKTTWSTGHLLSLCPRLKVCFYMEWNVAKCLVRLTLMEKLLYIFGKKVNGIKLYIAK